MGAQVREPTSRPPGLRSPVNANGCRRSKSTPTSRAKTRQPLKSDHHTEYQWGLVEPASRNQNDSDERRGWEPLSAGLRICQKSFMNKVVFSIRQRLPSSAAWMMGNLIECKEPQLPSRNQAGRKGSHSTQAVCKQTMPRISG